MRLIIASICFLLLSWPGTTQPSQEVLTVFTNHHAFVVGENLLIKIHCQEENGTRSDFSKVAYLELIDEKAEPVIRKKVALSEGTGSLVQFLPSSLQTGNYTLVAYTKWMKNTGSPIARQSIAIINPYRSLPQSEPFEYRCH